MADINELFNIIPSLIELFLPGYIFLYLNRYFRNGTEDNYDSTIVSSIIISYCINLFSSVIWMFFTSNTTYRPVLSIIISIASACVFQYLKRKGIIDKVSIKISRVAPNVSIWEKMVNLNKGSHIRFFMQYNSMLVCIEGKVLWYEPIDDGSCHFTIQKYTMYNSKGEKIYNTKDTDDILYINSKDMQGIELRKGK